MPGLRKGIGLTAESIGGQLNLKRSYVSHLLNELYKEGKAVKINTRPVYFIEADYLRKNIRLILIKKFPLTAGKKCPNI